MLLGGEFNVFVAKYRHWHICDDGEQAWHGDTPAEAARFFLRAHSPTARP
jgi:hypothetical protein